MFKLTKPNPSCLIELKEAEMSEPMTGAQHLARADVVQLRLSGMILEVLVQRGVLSREEAAAIVKDVAAFLTPDDAMFPAYRELLAQFN